MQYRTVLVAGCNRCHRAALSTAGAVPPVNTLLQLEEPSPCAFQVAGRMCESPRVLQQCRAIDLVAQRDW